MTGVKRYVVKILIGSLALLGIISTHGFGADADPFCGPVKVKKVTRITHPAYTAGNQFLNKMVPWNPDYSRMLIFENTFSHPSTHVVGKGYCWGYLKDLTHWTTQSEYEQARKPLPSQDWIKFCVFWSPFPGEENVVYGVRRTKKDVVSVNLDTGEVTSILTLDPGAGADITKGQGYGWSKNKTLIIGLVEHSAAADVLEVDVRNKTQKRFKPVTSSHMWDSDEALANFTHFPRGGNHGDTSGSGKWFFQYRGLAPENANEKRTKGGAWSLTERGASVYVPDGKHFIEDQWRTVGVVSLSFAHYADRWLMGVDLGRPSQPVGPAISTYTFCQIMFYPDHKPNFVYRPILKHKSATAWYESAAGQYDQKNSGAHLNYHSLCKLKVRRDGRQFVYVGTDGKYSWQDYLDRKMEPWDNNGMFLVDVEPDSEDASAGAVPFSSDLRLVTAGKDTTSPTPSK